MSVTPSVLDPRASPAGGIAPALLHALIPGLLIFALALFGIALRAQGSLSAFWPANAVLLGLMLRRPDFATPLAWISATCGLLMADLVTGSSIARTVLLTAANLAGVGAGWLALCRVHAEDLQLRRPSSTFYLVMGTAAASAASAFAGIVASSVLFDRTPLAAFFYWFVTEFANYIAILPVLLTVRGPWTDWRDSAVETLASARKAAPLLVTLASLALEPLIGGPGALTLAVPGLLWCALSYSVAATAMLTFLFAMWTFITLTLGTGPFGVALTDYDLISLRLGVTLVALAPITVAAVMSAREAMLMEAAAARRAAEDAMASRSLLLATMAHELRSPLGAVIGLAEVMSCQGHGPIGDQRYIEYAQAIKESGSHLNALVTDLLDTAKVEAGRIELAKAPVSSHALVEQSLCLVRGLAMDARVSLTMAPGEWADVYVDSRAIKQVLINLISNAIKFSPRESTVTISCECGPERLTVRVTDTGKGITPQELKLLGRAWAQAGEAAAQRKGTGLGLALSIQLVSQHGGNLWLESAPDAGTTAVFDLPRDI